MLSVGRLRICGVVLALFVVGKMEADEWQEVSRNANLVICTHHRSGSALDEVRAVGQFDVPMAVVREVLSDTRKYAEFMPYTKESRVLSNDEDLCYIVVAPPLFEPRDCTIRVHRQVLKAADGKTNFYASWEQTNKDGPPPRPGVARMNINNGSWLLETVGSGTRATCTICADAGGVPAQLANLINREAVIDVFEALRMRADALNQGKNHSVSTRVVGASESSP